ncbi:TMEM165/GDT1 family protein [Thiolapillus sp.]
MAGTESSVLALLTSYSLIGLAEFGDKSQLVCLVLAARYRARPVLLGAVLAFALLNLLAVVFGATLASWLPQRLVVVVVGLLFLGFGWHALRQKEEEQVLPEEDVRSDRSLLLSTLLLIALAEFGDKTQLAVAGLASANPPLAVWLGATLALATTSALGVWAGRALLQKVPILLLHRISGGLFLIVGVLMLLF